ncbi:hypothetical protein [Methylosinus sp. Sm6]|uniref:hypothetical protein n=1 Tax=Methylosinus sp. Sm6 TaxID=2866948 RepID=UPI001C9932DB|nr:hypothetical protein [Methylosinus sp. Sm6]MBY6243742.1 hypothetical protein [Methylosinus sp. Sm6]
MSEKHTYITTDRAGFTVAGRRIPGEYRPDLKEDGKPRLDEDGKPLNGFFPKTGFELELTEVEAEYELQQRTIVLKPAESKKTKGRAESDAPPSNAV